MPATSAASADVVILNLQGFSRAPWERPAGQIWAGTYFESSEHYPNLEGKNTMAQFNLTLGFRADADSPVFNMVYDTFKDFARVSN